MGDGFTPPGCEGRHGARCVNRRTTAAGLCVFHRADSIPNQTITAMSSNQTHESDVSTATVGDRVNFFDSQTGEFDLDREPNDPSKPTHETEEGSEGKQDDGDLPTYDELLGRDRGHHDYQTGVNRESWLAGTILRAAGNPSLYCPDCWHELDTASELTDPEHHLPLVVVDHDFDTETTDLSLQVSKNDHRRHRHCPECGAVSFGGVLGPRPVDELLDVVDEILDAVDEIVVPSRRENLKAAVRSRKERDQPMSDKENIAELVRDLRYDREDF